MLPIQGRISAAVPGTPNLDRTLKELHPGKSQIQRYSQRDTWIKQVSTNIYIEFTAAVILQSLGARNFILPFIVEIQLVT